MSPAKRLSRKRFRALCERCNVYLGGKPIPLRAIKRVVRYEATVARSNRRRGMAHFTAWLASAHHVGALARLAR